MHSSPPRSNGSSSNTPDIRRVFVRRVHQLVRLGYERMTPAVHAKEQETAITGFLVEEIDNVLNNRADSWMRFFSVHDDPPVNDPRRKGKQRRRVDLRVDSGHFTPRARFRFEAKRLGKRYPVTIYLGREGLGCFIRGDYSRDEDEAGMLGYVQSGTLEEWGQKIGVQLAMSPNDYALDPAVPFCADSKRSTDAVMSYHSRHARLAVGRSILISHTLLKFH